MFVIKQIKIVLDINVGLKNTIVITKNFIFKSVLNSFIYHYSLCKWRTDLITNFISICSSSNEITTDFIIAYAVCITFY